MKKNATVLMLVFMCLSCFSFAQGPVIRTDKKVVEDFMDKRFGMFIHWGPVSLRGTEIGWSRGTNVPTVEYDNLYKEFNPVLFDADKWAKTAKDAGMKYLTITSKHHDGFCLWPTAYSDYNIMNTPYKKDIVGELAKACKKYGLKFCIYFTVADWHDPDYAILYPASTTNKSMNMDRFVSTMKNQLKELIQNYKPYMLWFDANWDKEWTRVQSADVYNAIKKLDPNVLINNRLDTKDASGGSHKVMLPTTLADFATPEQEVGTMNMDYPWESCITICQQWAWKPNDKMKSLKECLQTLASTAGGNGNLLFNVGPMLDGRIEERQISRLKEMGAWLNKNGAAIYGTKGGPYKPDSVMAATRKGNKIYLHLFKNNRAEISVPAIPGLKITKVYLLDGAAPLTHKLDAGKIVLSLPKQLPDADDTVIVLEMDKNVESVPIFKS
ncbi:alpha-L-fucosidase [Pedobacter nyackensis]|uniref:alpha-L-fucosidase n=1 Tax=Pedobacter nyackensis TaxID=475255 RepID=UPI002931261F|nr:alpha-L-fucosidase [Pedobacter nyackensis]